MPPNTHHSDPAPHVHSPEAESLWPRTLGRRSSFEQDPGLGGDVGVRCMGRAGAGLGGNVCGLVQGP